MASHIEVPPRIYARCHLWLEAKVAGAWLESLQAYFKRYDGRFDPGDLDLLTREMDEAKQHIRVKASNRFTYIPMDFEGSKYKFINSASLDGWDDFQLVFVPVDNGSWDPRTKLLVAGAALPKHPGENLGDGVLGAALERADKILQHELRHMVQSAINYALWDESDLRTLPGGLPPKGIRTPQYDQNGKSLSTSLGRSPKEIHDLDDVEFHTMVADAATELRKRLKANVSGDPSAIFDLFVGRWGVTDDTYPLMALFQKYPETQGKYNSAVKELYKVLMRNR